MCNLKSCPTFNLYPQIIEIKKAELLIVDSKQFAYSLNVLLTSLCLPFLVCE